MNWIRQVKGGKHISKLLCFVRAAISSFTGATETSVFHSVLVQVSSGGRALPCYPCYPYVFHTLLELLSSCLCPVPRLLVL